MPSFPDSLPDRTSSDRNRSLNSISFFVASRLNAGYPRAGELYELDAVAAVVVGGTSLFGGRGSIWGTLAGAFFIGILNNGLNLYNVSAYDQMIAKGAVLLAAASLDRWR